MKRYLDSESENNTRSILEEQRDQLLSEATSVVLKQECSAERADCAIRELQRLIQSNSMEIDLTNIGFETSRREQAKLHEELAKREKNTSRNSY